MKKIKKIASLMLTLVMLMSLATTAFAANTASIIIQDNSPISFFAAKQYAGFRLLNLTVSLKDPDAEDGHIHDDDCYNYAYTVHSKYRSVLQAEVYEHADNSFWGTEGKPAAAGSVTDEQIIEYLESKTSDTVTADGREYGTLRPVADRLYKAIFDMESDATSSGTFEGVDQGYWLIADVTNLQDSGESNSLVMIDTKGENELIATPKTSVPEVEKKVMDTNDSTDTNDLTDEMQDADNDLWQDSADHDIGDQVPFQLTATLPSNVAYYESYQVVFHDTLSDGLTLDASSIKVTIDGVDVTDEFTKPVADQAGGVFEISCEDIMSTGVDISKDSKIVVTYLATLNENAVIGSVGNPNKVYLEFSNNPYDDQTGKTAEDKVIVFTYKTIVNKIDKDDKPLTGADFKLEKWNADTEEWEPVDESKKAVNAAGTIFTFSGLDDGKYRVTETATPAGYNSVDPVEFEITATHSEEADEPVLLTLTGGDLFEGNVSAGSVTGWIVNLTGTQLPETGGMGTTVFYALGGCMVLAAVVLLVTKKRMNNQ